MMEMATMRLNRTFITLRTCSWDVNFLGVDEYNRRLAFISKVVITAYACNPSKRNLNLETSITDFVVAPPDKENMAVAKLGQIELVLEHRVLATAEAVGVISGAVDTAAKDPTTAFPHCKTHLVIIIVTLECCSRARKDSSER